MTVTLRELTEANLSSVLEVHTAPTQERYVSKVADSMAEAAATYTETLGAELSTPTSNPSGSSC